MWRYYDCVNIRFDIYILFVFPRNPVTLYPPSTCQGLKIGMIMLPCKAKRTICLMFHVSRYCLLAICVIKGGGPRVVVSTAAFHARDRGSVPGLGGLKETKLFLPHPRVKVSIVGSLRDREVACSASDRQGSNFDSCVWRTVSSQSSHHPQEVLLAQFSLYVHKGGLKPDSFHFCHKGRMASCRETSLRFLSSSASGWMF